MRPTTLTALSALLVLGGCSLARGGHADRSVLPAREAPARAWHRTSDERLARHDLTVRWTDETPRTAIESVDPRLLANAFATPLPAREPKDPDPIRGAFDRLPEGHRWRPEVFLPSGGTLDLVRRERGRLHVRAWNQDQAFSGGGLGWTVPVRDGWHATAEIGVDPFRAPSAGGVAVVAGLGIRL